MMRERISTANYEENKSNKNYMKQNFKIGEKVKVIKSGMLKDLEGTVLSNNTDTPMKPLTVILADLGTWSFAYGEVISLSKETGAQEIKMPKKDGNFEVQKAVYKELTKPGEVAEVKTKRPYVRKDKSKPVKPKRKYSKKAK